MLPQAPGPSSFAPAARLRDPWVSSAAALAVVLEGVCGSVILAAAHAASTRSQVSSALPWLVASIAALAVSGVVGAFWFLSARQRVQLRSTVVRAAALDQVGALGIDAPTSTPVEAVVLHASGSKRYHRQGCALAVHRTTKRLSQAQASTMGLLACEVCRP